MPIKHATLTAVIGETQWVEDHDISALTLDEIGDGSTNKAFTSTLKTKLDGIEAGAEVNVNADWNAVSGDAQILNKPTIPTGDVVGDDTSTTAQNIVAYTGTGGKNITELTGTQGQVLYHNGVSWVKLDPGILGQYLETNGAGANPTWNFGAVIHSSTSSGVTTTGANTTPVNVSGAVFNYVANAVYRIWVMGRINSTAATTGVGIQFDLSSAVTAIDAHTIHPLTTTTVNVAYSIADDATVAPTTGVPAGPLDVPFITNALLVTGVNTGTCQLRFRSETTAVTELLAGVVMVVERVA
jgi:hypothetical protein